MEKHIELRVMRLREGAVLPSYAHPGDAGMDLFSNESVVIPPHESRLVQTGIAVELPPSTEAQIRPRSGLALKDQITVLNSPGTVDENYRGEIGVILVNHGTAAFRVEHGMRIAQMVIAPVLQVVPVEAESLSSTPRGANGFGSTGS